MTWQISFGHFWSYCLEICPHTSKEKGQQVIDHNLFPLQFQLLDGKDALQTAKKMLSIKISIILQILSAVYMSSPLPFI